MIPVENYEEFYEFMSEYTDFYNEVSKNEKIKMGALASDDLQMINKVLSEYQVYVTKAEIYEKKRNELFRRLGLEGKTFRAIIDMETGDCHDELEDLFYDFREAVMSAREYNNRSLDIVRKNLKETGNQGYDGVTDPACYDKNGTLSEKNYSPMNILDRQA